MFDAHARRLPRLRKIPGTARTLNILCPSRSPEGDMVELGFGCARLAPLAKCQEARDIFSHRQKLIFAQM